MYYNMWLYVTYSQQILIFTRYVTYILPLPTISVLLVCDSEGSEALVLQITILWILSWGHHLAIVILSFRTQEGTVGIWIKIVREKERERAISVLTKIVIAFVLNPRYFCTIKTLVCCSPSMSRKCQTWINTVVPEMLLLLTLGPLDLSCIGDVPPDGSQNIPMEIYICIF